MPASKAKQEIESALMSADRLLSARLAEFTPLRRDVLRLLYERGKATGAYDLVFAYQQRIGRRVAANTIYRTLNFLEQHRLVAHLPSQRRYVATVLPHEHEATIFFVCSACGTTAERQETGVERAVHRAANAIGFQAAKRAIEVDGLCARCVPQRAEVRA